MYEIGQRIGRFVVEDILKFKHPAIGRRTIYKIKCDCGSEKYISAKSDTLGSQSNSRGETRNLSCGCMQFDRTRKDLKGRRFGKLVVKKFDSKTKKFVCQCDCGNTCYVYSWELTRDGVDACENCRVVKEC